MESWVYYQILKAPPLDLIHFINILLSASRSAKWAYPFTERVGIAVTFFIRIREVLSSNLGLITG
jgi:hypothetical protein